MTGCSECGKPWGVILERGAMATDEVLAQCRAELEQELAEHWNDFNDPDDCPPYDFSHVKVYATDVVFIRASLNRFVDNHGICECTAEDECWIERRWADYPSWLLNQCKHRTAIRWDCCDITESECRPKAQNEEGAAK